MRVRFAVPVIVVLLVLAVALPLTLDGENAGETAALPTPTPTLEPTVTPTLAPTPAPTPTPEPVDNPPVILDYSIPDRAAAYGVFDISVEAEDDNGVDRVRVRIEVAGAIEDIALRETPEGLWTGSHRFTSTGTFTYTIVATYAGGQESDAVAGEIVSYAIVGGGHGGTI